MQKQPEVRVNYLNVCSPAETEQAEIAAALATIPLRPVEAADFEVSRGRSTLTEASPLDTGDESTGGETGPTIAKWVRIRHDLVSTSAYSNAQYSFSVDEKGTTETLVLHARNLSKGILQISLQDNLTTGTPAAVLASNTPVDRIRVERSGKPSLVLARCPGGDQSKYETLFRTGSDILARYRAVLGVKQIVPADLARVPNASNEKQEPRRGGKK